MLNKIKHLNSTYQAFFLIALLVASFVSYRFYTELNRELPESEFGFISKDLSLYIIILEVNENLDHFVSDPVFGDNLLNTASRENLRLYMVGLEFLDDQFDDIRRAIYIYLVIGIAIYLPGMILFLYEFLQDYFLATALAFVSLSATGFTIGSNQWGFSNETRFLPMDLFTVFLPWVVWSIYRFWWKQGQTAKSWHIVSVGMLTGILFSQIYGLTTIGMIETVFLLSVLMLFQKKISLKSVILFFSGAFLTGIVPYFLNSAQANEISLNFESAQNILSSPHPMVYPWQGRLFIRLEPILNLLGQNFREIPDIVNLYIILPYTIATLFLLALLWHKPNLKWALYGVVLLQTAYTLLMVNIGWLPLLLGLYGFQRIKQNKIDWLDQGLILSLIMLYWTGPIQQMVIHYLWKTFELEQLSLMVFEFARLQHGAYLPLYLLLGRMCLWFVRSASNPWLQRSLLASISIVIYFNLNTPPYPVYTASEISAILIGGFLLLYLAYPWWKTSFHVPVIESRLWVGLGLTLLVSLGIILWLNYLNVWGVSIVLLGLLGANTLLVGGTQVKNISGGIALLIATMMIIYIGASFLPTEPVTNQNGVELTLQEALDLSLEERNNISYPINPLGVNDQYLEMTNWVKNNTPEDALFWVMSNDYGFRYYASRSMLPLPSEVSKIIRTSSDYETTFTLSRLSFLPAEEEEQVAKAAYENEIDYIVVGGLSYLPPLVESDGNFYGLIPKFTNDIFVVHQVSYLQNNPQQYSLTDENFAEFQTHIPNLPFDENTPIFAPHTGDFANQDIHISRFGHLVSINEHFDQSEKAHYFDLIYALKQIEFQQDYPLGSATEQNLAKWRNEKTPENLQAAGFEYLLTDTNWETFITPEEAERFADETQYQLIREFRYPYTQLTYKLYQIAPQDAS